MTIELSDKEAATLYRYLQLHMKGWPAYANWTTEQHYVWSFFQKLESQVLKSL